MTASERDLLSGMAHDDIEITVHCDERVSAPYSVTARGSDQQFCSRTNVQPDDAGEPQTLGV